MADEDDGFNDEAFKGFGDDPAPVTPPAADPPADPATPPVTPPAETPKEDPKPPAEEPKKDDEPAKTPEETPITPASDEKKPEETPKSPETPATPPTPAPSETPQPLTKDDVESVVSNLLQTERASGKELEITSQEVLEKYYPDGLSNTLIDEKFGKELRTPADVVEVSRAYGEEMTTDQAAQWLMNEQYKIDNQVAKIKSDAKAIAETNVNFRRDSMTVLQKYEPLFKAYPTIQKKVFDKLMKQVKVDKDKGVILSAPDVMEYYDDYLEPYQQAFEFGKNKPATNPVAPETPATPKPSAEDRMDEAGDGGAADIPNDPNNFAQQVTKELAKGI